SPTGDSASSRMEEASLSSEQVPDNECNEIQKEEDGVMTELDYQNGLSEGRKEFVAPAVGMEFESYDDAYNYYNCYAKEAGFRVRVKNSWFKRNSREKYGAVLCCSSQGFKRIKDVNRLRKETRTGCPAMIRMRLVDSKRWRILEVTLEHNHLLGTKVYKSIKKMGSGTKRKSESNSDAEVQTVKLYRALVIDAGGNGGSNINAREERVLGEGNRREIRDYEVLYNRTAGEVRCICSCFNFYGYLCRHALCVLNFNGVEEVPPKYILSRWKKDYKRLYIPDVGSGSVDATDRVQWFNQLYRSALQVVEEGVISLDHYNVALQAFEESLNRVHDVDGRQALPAFEESLNRMDEVSLNSEPVGDDDADGFEIEGDCAMTEYVGQAGIIQGENPLPPAVGMEFESYEDVYYFYNCYAKDQGFGVRVSNTWYRKSKERYRGKLSCSSAGFKKKSEANRPRPETRTGCPAMIKFRLMDSKRWRIIEVEVEHNHLISPKSGKFYKSHKHLGVGTKRALQLESAEEAQKIRLFRTVVIDAEDNESLDVDEGVFGNNVDYCNQLKLKLSKLYTNDILEMFKREVEGMYSCFSTRQLNADGPIFTYIVKDQVEVVEEGRKSEDRYKFALQALDQILNKLRLVDNQSM
ncbi:protein far1-related sequence 6, partial [Quercus suber]